MVPHLSENNSWWDHCLWGSPDCSAASPTGCRSLLLTGSTRVTGIFKFPVSDWEEASVVLTPCCSLQLPVGWCLWSSPCCWHAAHIPLLWTAFFTTVFEDNLLCPGLVCQSKVHYQSLRKHTSLALLFIKHISPKEAICKLGCFVQYPGNI